MTQHNFSFIKTIKTRQQQQPASQPKQQRQGKRHAWVRTDSKRAMPTE